MPIRFRCQECRQSYTIGDNKAGASLKCQKCGTMMTVPNADAGEASPPASGGKSASPHQTAFNSLFEDEDGKSGDQDTVPPGQSTAPGSGAKSRHTDDLDAIHEFEQTRERSSAPATKAPEPGFPPPDDDEENDEEDEPKLGRGRRESDGEMDLTPMVDVVFQLLIFFMVTASFSIQKSQEVPAPDPEEKGASAAIQQLEEFEEESVTVSIDSRNLISVDDEPLSDPSRLEDVLRSKRKSEILITLHENAIHEMMVLVIDTANEIGMQKIRVGVTRGAE